LAGLIGLSPNNSPNVFMYIEPRGKSLIIRWTIDCQRYHISLPNHNHPVGKAAAQMKLAEIEKDILSGHFDPTLLKYKPRKSGKNPTEITAVELFGKYIDYRKKEGSLSHSSIGRLKAIASKLKQLFGDKLAEKVTTTTAKDAISKWSESASSQSIKTYLNYLKLCWDWAKGKYHTADLNPWVECLDRARSRGNEGQSRQQVKPFTITELQAIIAGFKSHSHYSHYTEFIVFLSHSACRFGEAAGLRWKHLGEDYNTAWIGESISRGHQNKKGTKTGKSRTVKLSPSVRSMLVDRFDRTSPQPDDLVFPSPKGLPINDHRFRARAWKTVLEDCQIEYRSPYKLRHSAISHSLSNGVNVIALAEQTGHSARVMLSTYAHAIDRECLFVDLG
jgi:integrase